MRTPTYLHTHMHTRTLTHIHTHTHTHTHIPIKLFFHYALQARSHPSTVQKFNLILYHKILWRQGHVTFPSSQKLISEFFKRDIFLFIFFQMVLKGFWGALFILYLCNTFIAFKSLLSNPSSDFVSYLWRKNTNNMLILISSQFYNFLLYV